MSINHSHLIAKDEVAELRVNISGLNETEQLIKDISAHIYATCTSTGISKFTCNLTIEELARLYSFLSQYEMIRDRSKQTSGEFIQIKQGQEELVALLESADHSAIVPALRTIIQDKLSEEDINIILGRRDSLDVFSQMLNPTNQHSEPEWQKFLEENEWIFGYGLRYKYLSILQRECHVSGTDLDGKNSVIADFLLSDNRFTKIVELKRPDTPLFKGSQNRSESWQLSSELTDAVSQILCQKANWEFESKSNCYNDKGERITETTCDVDCILLIGSSNQFKGNNKESVIKANTIELYRRNMRNIEIIFFDELLERAKFIVKGKQQTKDVRVN